MGPPWETITKPFQSNSSNSSNNNSNRAQAATCNSFSQLWLSLHIFSWRKTKMLNVLLLPDLKMLLETNKTRSDSLEPQSKSSTSLPPKRMKLVPWLCPTRSSSTLCAHTHSKSQRTPSIISPIIQSKLTKFCQLLMSTRTAWSASKNSSSSYSLSKLLPRLSKTISRSVEEKWIFHRCQNILLLTEKRLTSARNIIISERRRKNSTLSWDRWSPEFSLARLKSHPKTTWTSETIFKRCSGISNTTNSMRTERDISQFMTSLKVFWFTIYHSTSSIPIWTTSQTSAITSITAALYTNIVHSSTSWNKEQRSSILLCPKERLISIVSETCAMNLKKKTSTAKNMMFISQTKCFKHSSTLWTSMETVLSKSKRSLVSSNQRNLLDLEPWDQRNKDVELRHNRHNNR